MCIANVCFRGRDVIFEINLIFLITPFFHMAKNLGQKFKYLENEIGFSGEIKSTLKPEHLFYRTLLGELRLCIFLYLDLKQRSADKCKACKILDSFQICQQREKKNSVSSLFFLRKTFPVDAVRKISFYLKSSSFLMMSRRTEGIIYLTPCPAVLKNEVFH